MKPRISVIVTDLDDTLYDWVGFWHDSFSTMLKQLAEKSGVSVDVLERDFRKVHQKHMTSEYAFSIEELQCLREKHGATANLAEIYASEIEAYQKARQNSLRGYPGVVQTLQKLADKGCLLVGYTESMAFYTNDRLRALGLDAILNFLYSPPNHEVPAGTSRDGLRFYSDEQHQLRRTIQRDTPTGERKPNPALLLDILAEVGATPDQAIYIGDNRMKDVAMAKQARVLDAWAKYGAAQVRQEYNLLRRVSHWTDAEVEREKELLKSPFLAPSITLEHSFEELLNYIEPVSFGPRTDEQLRRVTEAWKKTIDVQQHFNDLELRIRNYALTLLTGVLGLAAFALKEKVPIDVRGWFHTSLASAVLVAGSIGWFGFYLMERLWYHRLLLGAVDHGQRIEKTYANELPELALTHAIAEASPTKVCGGISLHSSGKMNVFYGSVLCCLVLLVLLFHISAPSTVKPDAQGTATKAHAQP